MLGEAARGSGKQEGFDSGGVFLCDTSAMKTVVVPGTTGLFVFSTTVGQETVGRGGAMVLLRTRQ